MKRRITTQDDLVKLSCNRVENNKFEFEVCPPKRRLQPFKNFTNKGCYGIPNRLAILDNVDILNIDIPLKKYIDNYRMDVTLADFCHVHQYLTCAEFSKQLLSNTIFDDVVNAIISYLLDWPNEKLDEFGKEYPDFQRLFAGIKEFRNLDNGDYVYDYKGIPVIKTAIKLIKLHFVPKTESRTSFDWMSLVKFEFICHLNYVYSLILNDKFDDKSIQSLHAPMDIPYTLPNIDMSTLKQYQRDDNLKFITGQACCCKTTILDKFADMGWKKYSRSDVGSFSGKSHNPAAIGNLHASLNQILTRPDVIGDRGFIDNVLWTFIMPACNPAKKTTLVDDLMLFLNSNFNEACIAEYISQKGVIFIDPKCRKNRERQRNRCEDGDPWRSRLEMYAPVQFIVYYAAARLFGWKIICVPYTKDETIDDVKYNQNVDEIVNFFGKPKPTNEPYVRYSKPSDLYIIDNSFAKSVGIYK